MEGSLSEGKTKGAPGRDTGLNEKSQCEKRPSSATSKEAPYHMIERAV